MSKDQKIKPSKLTAHTGFWMRLVSNSVSYAFAQKLEGCSVTVAEWVVLREMYDGDNETSPSVIADLTGLSRGAISKLITRLLEKGLVNRNESTDDRRYQSVRLTAKAKGLVPRLAALADENDEDFFSVLSKSERQQLSDLLKKLAREHQIKTVPTE